MIEEWYCLPPKKLFDKKQGQGSLQTRTTHPTYTIKNKLISFTKLVSFLRDRKVYVGLDFENIKTIISTCDSCKVNLNHLCKEREQTMKKFKSSIFISSNLFKEHIICSEHIMNICKVIKEIQNDPKVFVDETTARDIRNYLMLLMCYTNCLRASHVVSITVHDVLEAKKHEEIKHAFFSLLTNIRHHWFMVTKSLPSVKSSMSSLKPLSNILEFDLLTIKGKVISREPYLRLLLKRHFHRKWRPG